MDSSGVPAATWKRLWILSALVVLAVSACSSSKSSVKTSTTSTSGSAQHETTTQARQKQAHLGNTLELVGNKAGEKMAVTIVRIIDPAQPSTCPGLEEAHRCRERELPLSRRRPYVGRGRLAFLASAVFAAVGADGVPMVEGRCNANRGRRRRVNRGPLEPVISR
jgi:hypothetical protein